MRKVCAKLCAPKKEDTGTFLAPVLLLSVRARSGGGAHQGAEAAAGSGGRRTYGAEGNIMASAAGAGVPDF